MTTYQRELIDFISQEEKEIAVKDFIKVLTDFYSEGWAKEILDDLNQIATDNDYINYEEYANDDLLTEFDYLCDSYLNDFFETIEESLDQDRMDEFDYWYDKNFY